MGIWSQARDIPVPAACAGIVIALSRVSGLCGADVAGPQRGAGWRSPLLLHCSTPFPH